MAMTTEFPDFRRIDTPWEPQPIAWRFTLPSMTVDRSFYKDLDKDNLILQVRDQSNTHIVREVNVALRSHYSAIELSIQETLEGLGQVDEQFQQLEALTDIRVAPTEWHVFADDVGQTRTLARVEIIDGDDRILPEDPEEGIDPIERHLVLDFHRQMQLYFKKTGGHHLRDINSLRQYCFGSRRTERNSPIANQALWLVDIEPLLC